MTLYADTSFLVSFLYAPDSGHAAAARLFAAHPQDQWLTSTWSQFETVNTLRQLCLSQPGPQPATVEALRRLFKRLHRSGPFEMVDTNFEEALRECQQLSAASGTSLRMRSADVLHVALLEQFLPDLFVTRNKDQHALAVARAFPSQLVS